LGQQSKGFFSGNANDNLLNAARDGSLNAARAAIGEGANICYKKNNNNAYEIAIRSITEYHTQMTVYQTRPTESQHYKEKAMACQQIVEDIRQIAHKRLVQSIKESIPYCVMAYHQAGAPLTGDLLYYSCSISDNVQIVDYLINQSSDIYQIMFNYSKPESPFHTAKKHKFNNVAAYLKYRLSIECTKAIQANDIEYTKKLIQAGASVDMQDTNNLLIAINHRNMELIEILCDNGVQMPIEWLQSQTIILPENIAQTIDSNIIFRLNRSLINRRLRLAAANGDLHILIQCQHLSADINSLNCHGSTALLCSIQYGNYFPVVHALVSRGATMLHTNENESMSLIALAKKCNYIQITNYLSQELNTQFLNTIFNNDIRSAEKLEALGADFNYRDEQKRTALHYAVQYHGIDLVSWLCIRGSEPTFADIDGNYPILEATEKGIYAHICST
jgi:ankyrin repeat protein